MLLDHADWFNSLQALDCKSESFLEWFKIEILAKKYQSHFSEIDLANLQNQSATAKNSFSSQRSSAVICIHDVVKELTTLKLGFDLLLKLISITITLPVSTASNERFFLCLKRVKTYVRSSIGEGRLANLMLISAEKIFIRGVDKNVLVDKFGKKKQRRYPVMHRN